MLRYSIKALALALGLFAAAPAHAAGGEIAIPDRKFSFDGIFGTYDRASAQRGFQVYKEVCAACHGMRLVAYRNLSELGLTQAQVEAIAAEFQITDGPNDEGQMFERPGRPSDRFRRPFPNEAAAAAANNGKAPPDLSVMAKARAGGAHYNKFYPGHAIAMGAPLNPDQVEYADGTKATVEQMAHDVSTFLQWAAEPELEQRRALGVKIIIFLTILAGLTYAVKRKVWADVEH